MSNRYSNWREDLSKELMKSKKHRNMFFNGLREEYEDDLKALRAIVKIIGLKEFSSLCKMPSSNISNYLKEGKDLKLSTIKKLTSPFDLRSVSLCLDVVACA